jgi:hypothetical protein
MNKEDLKNFTKDELEDIFINLINLINKMETDGNFYMSQYIKDKRKLELYCYAAGLLTKVNMIRNILSLNKLK